MTEFEERLAEGYVSHIAQGFCKEARVEQVQNRMLRPADIEVDRQPFLHLRMRSKFFIVFRVNKAEEVPRGADKGVHSVYLGRPPFAENTLRALGQFFALPQRRSAGRLKLNIGRQ